MRGLKEHLGEVQAELKEGRKRKVVADDSESSKRALADLRRHLDAVDAIKGFRLVRKDGKVTAEMTVSVSDKMLQRAIAEAAKTNGASLLLG